MNKEKLLKKDLNCEEHGYEKQYFCESEDCQEALCSECYIERHLGHPKKPIRAVYQEKRREFQDALDTLTVRIEEF